MEGVTDIGNGQNRSHSLSVIGMPSGQNGVAVVHFEMAIFAGRFLQVRKILQI